MDGPSLCQDKWMKDKVWQEGLYRYLVSYISRQILLLNNKVNSVQEACAKSFAVHLLTFEILQTTWKNKTKNIYWWKTEK